LLIAALPFIVLPLWRKTGGSNDVLHDAANLEILRDQSAELEADLRNGLLTQDAYEQGKRELQARLLEEVKTAGQPAIRPQHNPAKALAIALAVLLPLFSVPLYLAIGNPGALLPQQNIAGDSGLISSEAALIELEKKMEQQPEDPNGWFLLARSYSEMRRFPDAVRAYRKLVELVPYEAQLWANYADVTAMTQNQSLLGKPTIFLSKALELDGNNVLALMLSGQAAMERGDYVAAVTHWQKLADLLPPDYPDLQMIRDAIMQARASLAMQKGGREKLAQLPADNAPGITAANPAAAIAGKVALSPALAGKADPTDTVFILARPAEGPRMPLAVLRVQVKDLPMQFTLDDSMAMQPQLKLSGFEQVIVVARVSRSGNASAQPGDLQGMTGVVKPGSKGLSIVIDSVVQ
jgi:cytochrome c-type biogenesis protein CcmH